MLHVDIPTTADLAALASHRGDMCVSIYLPTTPLSQDAQADRIALKNLAKSVIDELQTAGADKRRVLTLADELDDLIDDDEFWRFQARSLCIFATPDNVRTFRTASDLEPLAEVSDRFHLKPLLRAVSFPNSAYVLALAEGSVDLIEVSADLPATRVKVDGLPKDAASAAGKSTINDRSPSGRIQGSEGQKVRLRQYARKVDAALRGLLAGSNVPLILAASEPLASIYRSVNSYSHLAHVGIEATPAESSDAELSQRARAVLDGLYKDEIADWTRRFQAMRGVSRATTDISDAARAATFGAVENLLVNIEEIVHGTIDEQSGAVTFGEGPSPSTYGVVDEIARRTIATGGRVLGVRRADLPDQGSLAAFLRYPV